MYIYKHHTQAHGGDIAVSSTVGEGTTFTIRIPCKSVGENPNTNLSGTPNSNANSNTPSLRYLGDGSILGSIQSQSGGKSVLNSTRRDMESDAGVALSPAFSLGTPLFLKSFDRDPGKSMDRDPGKSIDRHPGKSMDRDTGTQSDTQVDAGRDIPDNVDRDTNVEGPRAHSQVTYMHTYIRTHTHTHTHVCVCVCV